MEEGFSARQLGYEFVPKEFLEEPPLDIKKIESFELESPQSKKNDSDGSNHNPFV